MKTSHDEIADRLVSLFHCQTTTSQGTPLFKRHGQTATLLKRLVVEALQEGGRD